MLIVYPVALRFNALRLLFFTALAIPCSAVCDEVMDATFWHPACFAIALFAENVTDFKSSPATMALRDVVLARQTI